MVVIVFLETKLYTLDSTPASRTCIPLRTFRGTAPSTNSGKYRSVSET